MHQRSSRLKILAVIIFAVELVLVLISKLLLNVHLDFLAYGFLVVLAISFIYFIYEFEVDRKTRMANIEQVLNKEATEAYEYGNVGIIVFNDNYDITFISRMLEEDGFRFLGEKITKIEFFHALFDSESARKIIIESENKKAYECYRSVDSQAIFIKDITEFHNVQTAYNNEKLVLGLICLDNYDETIDKKDEQTIASINTNIVQNIITWVNKYHGVVRKIKSDRFLVVANEAALTEMKKTSFDILNEVKAASSNLDVDITASMAFACGTADISLLDTTINTVMELVLSRGGDQAAVKCIGEEIVYYGTSSLALEKTSKVRARVMSNSISGFIKESSKVFLVGHSDADLDCLGSMLGFDKIVGCNEKDSYIVFNDIKVEKVTSDIFENNIHELIKDHIFITPEEAVSMMDEDSLVVVLDHHTLELTSAPEVVNAAAKVIIVDHHRRKSDSTIPALLIYNEPAASSAVEIVTEMMQYQKQSFTLSETDASIMYAGLLIDTDDLKSRTSSRTFEACAYLKREGTDIALVNEWLKQPYQDYMNKINISRNMKVVHNTMAVAIVEGYDSSITRTSIAQSANEMLTIKDIEASFVVGQIADNLYACSGRSNGKVNVQIILEKMGGGGHFNAAGLQKSDTTVKELEALLLKSIDEYCQREAENESNSID